MLTVEVLQNINHNLAIAGLFGLAVIALLLFDLFTAQYLKQYVRRWGLWAMLIVVAFAVVDTLVYSEFFGIIPCGLCWLERVFMYPLLFIIAIALFTKDRNAPRYILTLSVAGLLIALYHHYIQLGGSQFIKCPAAGADCAKLIIFEFGFITFPLLAAIAFGMTAITSIYLLKVTSSDQMEG